MATLAQYQTVLDGAGERYHVLPLQNGALALITQRGARVLGVFPSPDAPNLLWTNSALNDLASFKTFVAGGGWNLGGERMWIAPEIQYNVRDRNDFWGTLSVPPQMNPGSYRLTVEENSVHLEQDITLTAYNLASGEKQLSIRRIRRTPNPLADEFMEGVLFAGYSQAAYLAERNDTPIVSEMWNLTQLNAGGTLVILTLPPLRYSEFFGSTPDEAKTTRDSILHIPITGKRQFKIGYKAASMTGYMAYHQPLADGQAALLVKSFVNNPQNLYSEEPPDQPGVNGHSVHVYNDGGEFGGDNSFGEMECNGTTIGGVTDRRETTDTFTLWVYVGAPDAIRRIAERVIGVTL